ALAERGRPPPRRLRPLRRRRRPRAHRAAGPRIPRPLMSHSMSIGQCATLACLLEATAPKAGNVHRGADFDDLTFADFAVSAVAIGPAMETAASGGVGSAVFAAIEST